MAPISLFSLLAATAGIASAHLCTLQPLQRGGASGAATTGAPACFQINGPCPNATAGAPAAAYLAGQVATVSMLKNLDHYNDASPGNFSAFLWNAKGVSQFLGAYPDTSAPSNSLYNLPVTIPADAPSGSYVLQTIYFADHAGAPAAFYQCSDVQVL